LRGAPLRLWRSRRPFARRPAWGPNRPSGKGRCPRPSRPRGAGRCFRRGRARRHRNGSGSARPRCGPARRSWPDPPVLRSGRTPGGPCVRPAGRAAGSRWTKGSWVSAARQSPV